MSLIETTLIAADRKGVLRKYPATLQYRDGRIYFVQSPFAAKDEIKSMQGSRWHGFEDPPLKQWSVVDSLRNRFQLEWLQGGNPYAHFEQPITKHEYTRPLRPYQKEDTDQILQYRYQILAATPGAGKTLVAFEVMERSGLTDWVWVGPKTTLPAIELELEKWKCTVRPQFMTYETLANRMKRGDLSTPQGIIMDEGTKVKTPGVSRTQAAQDIADRIRAEHGFNGCVLLMSGTPSPKSPVDIWSLAEIAYPGYLREGSQKALKARLAVLKEADPDTAGYRTDVERWLDEPNLCRNCGTHKDSHDPTCTKKDIAPNEVELLGERLKGLMITRHKKDVIDLEDKRYIRVKLKPTEKLLKVARAVKNTCSSVVTALSQLRQLSDGFLYRERADGTIECPTCKGTGEIMEWFNPAEPDRPYASLELMDPDKCKNFEKRMTTCCHCGGEKVIPNMVRETIEVPCPKDDVVLEWLDKCSETGRITLFAGFQGSIDRLTRLCREEGWYVMRCDGRGTVMLDTEGKQVKCEPLRFWMDMSNDKIAFVANPESGGFGLTLVEANVAVFYSNSYKPEYRVQAEERIHRPGQTELVTIVDLLHLPSDERTLELIRANRRLEKMVLGDVLGDCF